MKLFLKRLVQLGGFLILALVLAFAALHCYQPKVPLAVFPAPKPVSGAAVFFNQAFAAMPKLVGEESKILIAKPDQPLDIAKATQLLEKFEPSLKLLEKGAKESECEWGLDLNLGPAIPCPQAKGLKLMQVMRLRARLHLESGNTSAAADDVLLSLQCSRFLGEPGWIIGNLVRMSADMVALDFAMRHLSQFDAGSLQKLSDGIATIPQPHSMQAAVGSDREINAAFFYNQLANAVFAATKKTRGTQLSPPQGGQEEKNPQTHKPVPEITITGGLPIKLLVFWMKRYEQKSLELEALMGLPYIEARPQLDVFGKKLEKYRWINGTYALLLLPAAEGLRLKEVQMETAWAILQTVLNAQLHNPASVRGELAKLRDPFDDQPISMRDVEGGVEIQLKSVEGRKPVTLVVGLSGK